MNYEKEYKGALERCKWLLSIGMISEIAATDMFRELIDNDSENVRKEIINIFHSLADGKIPFPINFADIFTWLENIPYTIDHEKREVFHLGYKAGLERQEEQKPTDEEMKTLLRTEYEKGRADAIAEMQKPAWSKADDGMYNCLITTLCEEEHGGRKANDRFVCWLKSLKDRVQPKHILHRTHTIFDQII